MTAALPVALGARIVAPLLCLGAVLASELLPESVFEGTRNGIFDAYQRLVPGARRTLQVVLIDIDDDSIRRVGQWPWPRDKLARLVDAAAGARVVGLDILLSEPDRLSPASWAARADLPDAARQALAALPDTDAVLAASLRKAPAVLAAAATEDASPEAGPAEAGPARLPVVAGEPHIIRTLPHRAATIRPLPALEEAARGIGLVGMPAEADGILRRVPAVVAVGKDLLPGFAVEMLRVASGEAQSALRRGPLGARRLTIGKLAVPTDAAGRIWLRHHVPEAALILPAWQVLDGSARAELAGRIVLIGASATGLGDTVVSPLHQRVAGVSVQIQLLENMLAGETLWRPGFVGALEALLTLALGVAATLLFGRLRDRAYALVSLGVAVLLVAGSLAAFSIVGLLLDWTMPLTALSVTMLAAAAARIRDEVEARQLREGELATALMQAEAADRAKTEFLANASHELRTPLTAVIGFSEMMAREMMGPLSPIYAEYAGNIHQSAKHLLAVIDDVLDLSVIDLGGMEPRDETIIVKRLLAECERMVAVRAADRAVLVRQELAPALPTLRADPRMVRQMVLNLLSNAIKYSPRDGQVDLAAHLGADGWLAIAVRDRGPGIAAADIPHAIQRFGRLRSATMAQEPGIGIGLPLTKSMVELHGGRFEIKSTVGVGTEVLLWFPASRLTTEGSSYQRASD